MFFDSKRDAENTGGPFRFRVSDALAVPLRGYLLRLRLLEGRPDIDDVRPGRSLRLAAPDGEERRVRIKDHSTTGGRQTQERLDRYGELDLIIAEDDAVRDGRPVTIGWLALGPVGEGDERRERAM